jgi:hypothetical protein
MSDSLEFRTLSDAAHGVKIGRYRHFKGGEYEVLGVGKHTETLEEFVVYRPVGVQDKVLSIRPVAMFLETVTRDGVTAPRFHFLGGEPS